MEQELINIFKKALKELNYDDLNVTIDKSDYSDYQYNGLFKIAKIEGKKPQDIGDNLIKKILEDNPNTFQELTFTLPGFINIKLSDAFINQELTKMVDNDKYNVKMPLKEKYVMDYGGYNIAKPLHIGHLRPTIVGESIKRILKYFNQEVIADVHLGDIGLQIGQVIYGIIKDNKNINDIDIDYLNEIYPKISKLCKEDKNINNECAEITYQLQNHKEEYVKLYERIKEVSLEDIKKIIKYFDIEFDTWKGEADALEYLPELTTKIEKYLEESQGAKVIDVAKDNDDHPVPPLLYQKTNGAYLYDSTDLATLYERKLNYHPNHVLYVTDFRQKLHFEQLFRASSKIGLFPYEALEHCYNGTINGKDNKPFKTREGTAPKLEELIKMVEDTFLSLKESNKELNKKDLDIIVNAIIKYADLSNIRTKDYIFDIKAFSDVQGKTGPYILYTYVRINKILKEYKTPNELVSNKIYNDLDRNLRIKLLELPKELYKSYQERMPSYIANYLYDLCTDINVFYENNRLNSIKDEDNKNDWLYILNLANHIIKDMLQLLIIDVPSVM